MKYLKGETFLMPDQDQPFNGDTFACAKFLELKERFRIKKAIELGTCVGGTTKWLSENFEDVIGIEIMPEYLAIAKRRATKDNISFHLGSTIDKLPGILAGINEMVILHIDSHWGPMNPLLQELDIIAKSGLKPVIEIHDFKVPGHPELGFDSYKGQDYDWDWIKDAVKGIYGENFEIEYNSEGTGAKRGIIYITPKNNE